jgi:hypothetical protein
VWCGFGHLACFVCLFSCSVWTRECGATRRWPVVFHWHATNGRCNHARKTINPCDDPLFFLFRWKTTAPPPRRSLLLLFAHTLRMKPSCRHLAPVQKTSMLKNCWRRSRDTKLFVARARPVSFNDRYSKSYSTPTLGDEFFFESSSTCPYFPLRPCQSGRRKLDKQILNSEF